MAFDTSLLVRLKGEGPYGSNLSSHRVRDAFVTYWHAPNVPAVETYLDVEGEPGESHVALLAQMADQAKGIGLVQYMWWLHNLHMVGTVGESQELNIPDATLLGWLWDAAGGEP